MKNNESMKAILEAEHVALRELVRLLEEEKQLLMGLKEPLLFQVVDAKRAVVERIESLETKRKSMHEETKFQEFLQHHPDGKTLLGRIGSLLKKARDLQETNMMLTTQSINYNNTLIQIIQDAVVKAPSVYSGRGYMKNRSTGVRAAFDQSV